VRPVASDDAAYLVVDIGNVVKAFLNLPHRSASIPIEPFADYLAPLIVGTRTIPYNGYQIRNTRCARQNIELKNHKMIAGWSEPGRALGSPRSDR